jgi:hypothetical protein
LTTGALLISARSYFPSSTSSKINSNLLFSRGFSGKTNFLLILISYSMGGGGYIGSITILNIDAILLKGILKHVRNDSAEQGTREFEARIGIGFNEPNFEVLIDEEIQSKDLKRKLFFVEVHLGVNRTNGISC